jgi:O-succinylbenzoic acid--CoA ligase
LAYVKEWIAEAARRRPEHPWLVTDSESWTFERFEDRVSRLAGGLRSRGVAPGSIVALWATNEAGSAAAMFAVWRLGAAALLLNTRLTGAEAGRQLEEAGARLALGSAVPDLGVESVSPVDVAGAPIPPRDDDDPGRLALVVFTSGSSGRPKGVRLTMENLEASARASALHLGHMPEDRWLCNLPIFHVGGASILIRSAREATTVLLEPGFDPIRTVASLRSGDATVASLVAATLARTLEAAAVRYSGVKAVIVGGGPVPHDLVLRAREAGLPALASYGMTETASQVATARLEDQLVVPLPGAEIETVEGRIRVRGPMVSPGYLGESDRVKGAWFETGDLGAIGVDGGLEIFGRADDVIVTGGENVFPGEIEAVLREHPAVTEVVVVGVPDAVMGSIVAAVYEGAASPGELERIARFHLAGFKVPRRWLKVDVIPRRAVGKPDRAAVHAMVG